ncbi:MAG: helix-turn-helix domain-containing protein [Burkholderiaceae bacterium]
MIDIVDLFNACLYIQDNLDADLSLLFLAQTVGLSRFRFHRVFKAWRGETLHDFVTRMRMERAAFELSYPIPRSSRRSIKAIAFASGYKSLSSFSHAFTSYSQLSPRAFRNRALRRKTEGTRADYVEGLFGAFSIDVSNQPERQIAILDTSALPKSGVTLSALARLSATAPTGGDRFAVELLPNVLARSRGEDSRSAKVTRLGCVGVGIDEWRESAQPSRNGRTAPRSTIRLAAGRYAVLEGSGSLASLYRAWRRGFDDWLAQSGECPKAERLYVRFPESGADIDASQTIALYIPLEDLPVTSARPARLRHSMVDAGVAAS